MKHIIQLFLILSLSACTLFAPSTFEKNKRSPGVRLDDEIIAKNIALHFKKAKLNENHINITSFNAIVLLTGEVADEKTQKQISQIAESVYQARKVYNQTRIAAPSSLTSRTSDSLITAHIKTKMYRDKDIRKIETKVVTENGIAYLMGIVSATDMDKIIHIVKSVGGVQRIVKLFEIIE